MKETGNTHLFTTPYGDIIGWIENGVVKASHIRYAYSERCKMPVGLKVADPGVSVPQKTPVCPQNIRPLLEKMIGETDPQIFEVHESPQYLSITLPEKKLDHKKLPVVVWIHGGSYEVGCGDLPTTDASTWVKEQNIMVVSITYRLGLFGFLGNGDSRPPNLGLLDMIEGLKWIKTNIEDFGGDSDNITLFGQSSGGDAVAHLMVAEGVDNLFHRVIIQSAPLGLRSNRKRMMAEFSKKTENIMDNSDVLEMVEAYKKQVPSVIKYGLKAGMPFSLQYGFAPLPNENEVEGRWKQNAKKFEVLIGMNHHETAFFLSASGMIESISKKRLGKKILQRSIRTTTEKIYGKPAKKFAHNYADAGGNVYLFRIHSGLENNQMGAAHCIDLPLIFGNESAWKSAGLLKDIPWTYIHETGQKIRSIWAEFARTGSIGDKLEKPEILEVEKINGSN